MLFEIEDGAPQIVAEFEVEVGGDDLVVFAQGLRRDLAGGGRDRRAADHRKPVLGAAFRRRKLMPSYPRTAFTIFFGCPRASMVVANALRVPVHSLPCSVHDTHDLQSPSPTPQRCGPTTQHSSRQRANV